MVRNALVEPQARPAAQQSHASGNARVHLLVVDDDPHILKLCEYYLKDAERLAPAGLEPVVHRAGSGEEALETARGLVGKGERVACAFVDMVLPGCDGVATMRGFWDLDPDVQCTLVTGAGERVEQGIQQQVPAELLDRLDYVSKPFTEFEFVQRMRRALATWCAHRGEEHRHAENRELVARLERVNAELEDIVRERTRALAERSEEQERKNQELERALRDLEAAQSKLLQQEKMACIGQLAAGVAHELNNPIGFVHSNLGTLRRYCEKLRALVAAYAERVPDDEPEVADLRKRLKIDFVLEDTPALIEESLEGTERVRKIVSDLKVFSHPAEQEPKFANLNEGLESTLNIVHNEIKYKAKAVTEFGDIPPVRCLPNQINQVFMNVLVNAAHAIEESGEIRIRTEADGDGVVITIADSGCGIPPEALGRVFDPFFTTKDVGKGTGLGLSISYDIVRKHGGTMAVESAPGEGTTFTIRLPKDGGAGLGGEG